MSLDKTNHMLSKFNFTFTWEYHGDGEMRSVLPDVFRLLEKEDERSLEQILIGCVHQANPGLTLSRQENNLDVSYEIKFVVHPPHESFCITKIIILSEARNLELYINGGYEKSARGIMLTLNKERKLSLFEAQFDLSGYVETKSNATIKFLSYPCKDHIKLQAVIMKVEECEPISLFQEDQSGAPVSLSSVKRFLGSVGRPLSTDARKMLQSIENYQMSPAFKAQQMLTSQAARLQNTSRTRETGSAQNNQILQNEEKAAKEERHCASQPEHDEQFMKMLAQLGLDDKSSSSATHSSPQTRWAAYLQSRARANKTTSSESTNKIPRSMSLDGYSQVKDDRRTRQRPNSVGCVGERGLDRSFSLETFRDKRCDACGCPGCISVFDSISTNIFAAEKRILEKVDEKMMQMQEELNTKFQLLYQLLVTK